MIPAEFDYVAPANLADALRILNEHGENAKLLAGGHSLIPLMKLRLARPELLIDLRNVSELRGIRQEGDHLRIGAMTTHAEVAATSGEPAAPALAQAAHEIGDCQVRAWAHRRSLAHNDPAADLPAVMLALDAQIVLRSSSGERVVALPASFEACWNPPSSPTGC
jgi:carbon-monoxide dehydrogenase medium subunit